MAWAVYRIAQNGRKLGVFAEKFAVKIIQNAAVIRSLHIVDGILRAIPEILRIFGRNLRQVQLAALQLQGPAWESSTILKMIVSILGAPR